MVKRNELIPDLKDSLISIYTSKENIVIVEFISSSTSPDRKNFTLPVYTIFEIKEGLISKGFSYYDHF